MNQSNGTSSPQSGSAQQAGSSNSYLAAFLNAVVCSEWCLIEFMVAQKTWTAPSGQNPPLRYKYYGSMENGLTLYLLNNQSLITNNDALTLTGLLTKYMKVEGISLPASNISSTQYTWFTTNSAVSPDGTILGMGAYEAFDQGWVGCLYNLLLSVYEKVIYPTFAPPKNSPAVTMSTDVGSSFTIGLVSDWGTGNSTAKSVMSALTALNPYCIVHLGDVYYSGSPSSQPNGLPVDGYGFSPLGEEATFVGQVPTSNVTCLTLNSNHEMYCGGYGLFADALASGTPFQAQAGSSMFTLQVGDWTILALDTAYNSDPNTLYMYGQLDAANSDIQAGWIKGLNLPRERVIVLSHHNALQFSCNPEGQRYYAGLWAELQAALGGDPFAWYWGHVHYGVAYSRSVMINSVPKFSTRTFCRCLGHGALPFGQTTELQAGGNVEWFATEGAVGSNELFNGFVTLTFDLDGESNKVTSITENFYDIGSDNPRFTKVLFQNSTS